MYNCVAFIVSNSWANSPISEHGEYNGYVAVPQTNRYHGKSWDEINKCVSVHGGVTFSEPATNGDCTFSSKREYKPEYIGKPCYILDNAEFITGNTEIGGDWWIFGFDTFHCDDNKQNWNKQAVIAETLWLLRQLEAPNHCGSCLHFKDEDVHGRGYCDEGECSVHCGFYGCREWKQRKEDNK